MSDLTAFLTLIGLVTLAALIVIITLCVLIELFLHHIAAGEPDSNGDPERDAAGMGGSPAYHGAARGPGHDHPLWHAKSNRTVHQGEAALPRGVRAVGASQPAGSEPQSSVPPIPQRRRLAEGRVWA